MKTPWTAVMWLALSVPAALDAQAAEAGERVRVRTTDGARVIGSLVEITSTDVGLRNDDGDVRIALDRVQWLERSLGERRRFGRNFFITTGVGALAMGTVAAATNNPNCVEGLGGCASPGEAFMLGFIVGGILSAPIGLIVGLAVHSERWEPATITLPASASLTLTSFDGRRVAFGASVPVGPRR